ncbi:alkaline phosphatase family protein [Patescibacteria group bacterium]|nr:alkaline phosphatase family protein [Patescibacteria group bacterium]
MVNPDYTNCIVNVSSSIMKSFGLKTLYVPLKELQNLETYENVVLLIIDGLGNEFFKKNGKNSFLHKHFVKTVTSTFPSTTSAATTALETGFAPQQHGVMGWFMYLEKEDVIFAPWSFTPRIPQKQPLKLKRSDVFLEPRITDKISPSFLIYGKNMAEREVNKDYDKLKSYSNLDEMFKQIKDSINSSKKRKFILSHWGGFDEICHSEGCSSAKTKNHFLELDKKLSAFVNLIKDTNTTFIITSDHGQIDTSKSKAIDLKEHPKLKEMLRMPLCGEHRFTYCYVYPDKTKQFEEYIKKEMNFCCDIYKNSDLIKQNMFGLFKSCNELKSRIGDYVLIMKDTYTFKDWLPDEKEFFLKAVHGGKSKEEMNVTLIWIK